MKRIWMLTSSFYPHIGGAEQQAQRLSQQLVAQGWEVTILTRRHNPRYAYLPAACESIDGVPVRRVFSNGSFKLGSLLYLLAGLWYLWRHARQDVYHAHDLGAPALLSVLAKLLCGGRSVVKLRGGVAQYERLRPFLLFRLQFWFLKNGVDCFVAVNRDVIDYFKQRGVGAEKLTYIPNGIDVQQFRPVAKAEKAALRRALGLAADAKVVLFVGRLETVKGPDVLLQAWQQLPAPLRRQARLIFVGEGSKTERLRTFVAQSELAHVCFAGRQENIADYYQAADLFVLPSRSEGLSNALVEAMACGLPVISSAVGGALDLIEPDVDGCLFPNEDAAVLSCAIARFLQAPGPYAAMAARGRRLVEEKVSLPKVAAAFAGLYTDLLDG